MTSHALGAGHGLLLKVRRDEKEEDGRRDTDTDQSRDEVLH